MVDPRTIGERVLEISDENQVAQTSRRICILRHLCHVESERQTEIQVAGLYKRPGVSRSYHGQLSPSADNNEQELSQIRFVGASFSGLSMRIFLLRARSTSPHASMFMGHTSLGLSPKDGCLHRPNSGRGKRGSIP